GALSPLFPSNILSALKIPFTCNIPPHSRSTGIRPAQERRHSTVDSRGIRRVLALRIIQPPDLRSRTDRPAAIVIDHREQPRITRATIVRPRLLPIRIDRDPFLRDDP